MKFNCRVLSDDELLQIIEAASHELDERRHREIQAAQETILAELRCLNDSIKRVDSAAVSVTHPLARKHVEGVLSYLRNEASRLHSALDNIPYNYPASWRHSGYPSAI
jgi:hypothetical protein